MTITRRTLLQQMLSAGLASSVIPWIGAACASKPAPSNKQVTLTWLHEYDSLNVYNDLVRAFNLTNTEGIYINHMPGPEDSTDYYNQLMNTFQTPSNVQDLLSLDVAWTGDLVNKHLLVPLSKRYGWPGKDRTNYLQVPLQAATFSDGVVWAAPFRSDVALLYSRKDLPAPFSPSPKTWAELSTMAVQAAREVTYGYVWQGAPYEGLVCDFIEVLSSFGGAIVDPHDPTKVTIDSPQAVQALTTMTSWVGTISPTSVTTFKEQEALEVWLNKKSAFMRNWTYAVALSSDASKLLKGNFVVAPLPAATSSDTGHSCLGGWQLGINAASSSDKQDAAMQFIRWMLQEDAQQYAAIVGSWAVALQSIYSNPYVTEQEPLFSTFKPIIDHAVLRPHPQSAPYHVVSQAIYSHVYQALTKQLSPAQALQALQRELQQLM